MADLTITASGVLKVSGSEDRGIAGVAVTAGQSVYLDSSTGKYLLADANLTAVEAACVGIALHGALANQPLTILISGNMAIGATVVKGGIYVVSTNAGMIAPFADLGTGHYLTILGWANDTTHLEVKLSVSGITHA